ncbi:MAG: LamG-like jellyroll fold domain-containing protein [Acidobacteriota bacterium]
MTRVVVAAIVMMAGACGRLRFDPLGDARSTGDVPGTQGDAVAGCATTPGLVAYWPLDDGAGTVAHDISPNAQDGDVVGGATWVAGRIGGALQFDGVTGAIDLRTTSAFGFGGGTGSFTLAYWVNATSLTNRADIRTFELAHCTGVAYIVGFVGGLGDAGFSGYDATNHYATTRSQQGILQVGTWVHVAHVLDRTNATGQTYIDGVASGAPGDLTPWVDTIDCSTTELTASLGGWGTFYYEGALDDVRVYSRALTATEVADLAARTTTGCP